MHGRIKVKHFHSTSSRGRVTKFHRKVEYDYPRKRSESLSNLVSTFFAPLTLFKVAAIPKVPFSDIKIIHHDEKVAKWEKNANYVRVFIPVYRL